MSSMRKELICNLTDIELDWAVATCEGHKVVVKDGLVISDRHDVTDAFSYTSIWNYTLDWELGGPLIVKHNMMLLPTSTGWIASKLVDNIHDFSAGSSLLQAAMRCYLKFQEGDDMYVPIILLK